MKSEMMLRAFGVRCGCAAKPSSDNIVASAVAPKPPADRISQLRRVVVCDIVMDSIGRSVVGKAFTFSGASG